MTKTEALNERLDDALDKVVNALLSERVSGGYWRGQLSSSALSTATAIVALQAVDARAFDKLIAGGRHWLASHQNADGGWGDTIRSRSNLSTTALCWAAFAGVDAEYSEVVGKAMRWLGEPGTLPTRIADRYGKDRTFSVPILMMLALTGRLGADGWRLIPKLPFELAALSHRVWGVVRMPVVSYALPALIAIGQAIHHHAPTRNPILWLLRVMTRGRTLRVLETLQPSNGGFLEATPLTAFVTMALASSGRGGHCVAQKGVEFLQRSVRSDGSWPIDTDLAMWTTTLAVKAIAPVRYLFGSIQRLALREWILRYRWSKEHPYTHAAPGGWAWTDLPGGVPDADDTAGALLALLHLGTVDGEVLSAGVAGCHWLLGLQNRDGGIPTFCKGWGTLPFDRSAPDITAHALRAWCAWLPQLPDRPRVESAMRRGLRFLEDTQRADGAWIPLWFGNEAAPNDENPLYGTACVVTALRALSEAGIEEGREMIRAGEKWLIDNQNDDGGWGALRGTPSSVEETALAIEALARSVHSAAVERGAEWLCARVEDGSWRRASPIGFYFAKLWYHERLYPMIWTAGALVKLRAFK